MYMQIELIFILVGILFLLISVRPSFPLWLPIRLKSGFGPTAGRKRQTDDALSEKP